MRLVATGTRMDCRRLVLPCLRVASKPPAQQAGQSHLLDDREHWCCHLRTGACYHLNCQVSSRQAARHCQIHSLRNARRTMSSAQDRQSNSKWCTAGNHPPDWALLFLAVAGTSFLLQMHHPWLLQVCHPAATLLCRRLLPLPPSPPGVAPYPRCQRRPSELSIALM